MALGSATIGQGFRQKKFSAYRHPNNRRVFRCLCILRSPLYTIQAHLAVPSISEKTWTQFWRKRASPYTSLNSTTMTFFTAVYSRSTSAGHRAPTASTWSLGSTPVSLHLSQIQNGNLHISRLPESGLSVGEPVDRSHMVAEFTQDLNTTRDSFQYHCKFSGSHLAGICNNPTLTIDQKSIKLQMFNHGFNLPIWVPVVSETDDFIEDCVLLFGGSILPASRSSYYFYDELAALARLPFTLPPMDLTEGEDMDWGSGSDEE